MAGQSIPYQCKIPKGKGFRVQAFYIFDKDRERLFEDWQNIKTDNFSWTEIHDQLAEEYGLFDLYDINSKYTGIIFKENLELFEENHTLKMFRCFFLTTETKRVLDSIELVFQSLKRCLKPSPFSFLVEKMNERFEEHSLGYALTQDGFIIRKDSEFMHTEVLENSLKLLHNNQFKGAEDEFLKAHKHYLKGQYKEAINEAHKSFESTMKTICQKKGWDNSKTSHSARHLIQIMFDKQIIPQSMKSHFDNLRATLETGLPTLRNKTSSHGQGPNVEKPHRLFAQYALNLAATNIILLVESYKNSLPK